MSKSRKTVKFKGSHFFLYKESDKTCGDSGPLLTAFDRNIGQPVGKNGEIKVGYAVQCGSFYARTMQWQDWWLTTAIEEILEVAEDGTWARFRTLNSIYKVGVQ